MGDYTSLYSCGVPLHPATSLLQSQMWSAADGAIWNAGGSVAFGGLPDATEYSDGHNAFSTNGWEDTEHPGYHQYAYGSHESHAPTSQQSPECSDCGVRIVAGDGSSGG